jgi:MFS family permease
MATSRNADSSTVQGSLYIIHEEDKLMDVLGIFFLLIVGGIVAFAIGLLAVGYVAILIDGYKEAKLFGLTVAFIGCFGLITWLVGGIFFIFSDTNNNTGTIVWRILVYILVALGFSAFTAETWNIIQWWKKQWPEVYGQK